MRARRAKAFKPADEDWVVVGARAFFFEPWGSQFEPETAGQVLVRFGTQRDHHRGVEVSVLDDGWVSLWLPEGARTYWLPPDLGREEPWETALQPLDYQRGVLGFP